MKTEPFYDLAKTKLSNSRSDIVKCLDSRYRAYGPEIKDVWGEMTRDERGWYVLFMAHETRADREALAAISPNAVIYEKMYRDRYRRADSYKRDILTVSIWEKWLKLLMEGQTVTSHRSHSYSANDIPVELAIREDPEAPSPQRVRRRAGEASHTPDEGWARPTYWQK